MNGGGPKEDLADLIKGWERWCETHKVSCSYEWIRREENTVADKLSKAIGLQLTLKKQVLQMIEAKCGSTAPWRLQHVLEKPQQRILAVPNFNHIGDTLRIIQQHKLRAVIVYPAWPAQPWWPAMLKAGVQFSLPDVREAIEETEGDGVLRNSRWRLRATIIG